MIKTQNVLQANVLHINRPIVSLSVSVYDHLVYRHDVQFRKHGDETYFTVSKPRDRSEDRPEDLPRSPEGGLREITNALLDVKTPDQAKALFEKYGLLGRFSNWPVPSPPTQELTWSDVVHAQTVLRQAWTLHYTKWGAHGSEWLTSRVRRDRARLQTDLDFYLHLDFGFDPPVLYAVVDTILGAAKADLYLATIAGLPSGFCARPDCGKLFQKTSKHEKKYCSPECAHVESVRKFRNRQSRSK